MIEDYCLYNNLCHWTGCIFKCLENIVFQYFFIDEKDSQLVLAFTLLTVRCIEPIIALITESVCFSRQHDY